MKILIYGAGVVGGTYGWLLSKAGHEITIMVRSLKKELMEKEGVVIHCSDFRSKIEKIENVVFRPKVIEKLLPDNEFDYIIVSVRNNQLSDVLPILNESSGKANVLFLMNIWNFDLIDRFLSPSQYFVGFPFMVGGGNENGCLRTIISGSKYSKTMLGELDGKITERLQVFARLLDDIGLRPFISTQITNWIVPHAAFIAALSAGIINEGSTSQFVQNPNAVRKSILNIRRGFDVCAERGIDPKKEKVNRLYYLPLFICTPIVKKIFGDKVMQMMFDRYLKCSKDEVRSMLDDIYGKGNGLLEE